MNTPTDEETHKEHLQRQKRHPLLTQKVKGCKDEVTDGKTVFDALDDNTLKD